MTNESSVQGRLEQATNLGELLDAAYEAFEEMLSIIGSYHNNGRSFYAGLVMAAPPAANGRDAIAAAPSLPPASPSAPSRRGRRASTPPGTCAAAGAAAHVAAISTALADTLLQAAGLAGIADDREACYEGARYASEIHGLVGGNEP